MRKRNFEYGGLDRVVTRERERDKRECVSRERERLVRKESYV